MGWVNFAKSRDIEGRIISATVSRTPVGEYYISILCDVPYSRWYPVNQDKAVGIDLGIKNFAITSDGQVIANPKYYRKYERKLRRLQRQLSRKQKGSSNRNKTRLKAAKAHRKVRNCRLDFLHKLSTRLIRENQTICLEDLQVKNML